MHRVGLPRVQLHATRRQGDVRCGEEDGTQLLKPETGLFPGAWDTQLQLACSSTSMRDRLASSPTQDWEVRGGQAVKL